MAFVNTSTENPLGNRPLNLMARQQGMGWLGSSSSPTPGDYNFNEPVLGALVQMGAITQQDADNIFNGLDSLDNMAVNMTMINQALQLTGQAGTPTVTPIVGPTQAQASGTVDPTQESNWNSALSYLQQWNKNLNSLESLAMQHPNDPAWSTFDSNLLNSQKQYASVSGQFTTIYRAVYGHIPAGLAGGESLGYLGQFDPVSAAAYAAILSAVLITAIAGYEYTLSLQTQAQALLQQQQTAGALANQAAALRQAAATAAAQGNTTLAAQYTAQADALSSQATTVSTAATTAATSTSFTAFLQNNLGLIAGLAVAVVVLPPLIRKI